MWAIKSQDLLKPEDWDKRSIWVPKTAVGMKTGLQQSQVTRMTIPTIEMVMGKILAK